MGKIDIDYQKLHDAFFKYVTYSELGSSNCMVAYGTPELTGTHEAYTGK